MDEDRQNNKEECITLLTNDINCRYKIRKKSNSFRLNILFENNINESFLNLHVVEEKRGAHMPHEISSIASASLSQQEK